MRTIHSRYRPPEGGGVVVDKGQMGLLKEYYDISDTHTKWDGSSESTLLIFAYVDSLIHGFPAVGSFWDSSAPSECIMLEYLEHEWPKFALSP